MSRPLSAPAGGPPGPAPHPGGPGGKLTQLTHNKPLMLTAGAVVAVGAVVFLRKRNTAAGSTSTAGIADGSSLAGTPGNPAALNSVGTDVASQLGQFGAAQQQQLTQWLQGLTTTLTSGSTIPTEAAAAGIPGQYNAGENLYDWADRNVKAPHATAGDALNILRSLNPGLNPQISWAGPAGTTKIPSLPNTTVLKIV